MLRIDRGPGPVERGNVNSPFGVQTTGGVTSGGSNVPFGDYAAHRIPDIVGSLRVDQAWGSAQIAAALHELRTGFYGNNVTSLQLGSPESKMGYAAMLGININLPWARGDAFWVEGIYTQGALGYLNFNQNTGYMGHWRASGNTITGAWGLDAIFGGTTALGVPIAGAPTSLELTTAWAINAALQHYWTPTLRTSIFGAYAEVDFNSTATQYFAGSGVNGPCRTLAGGVGSILAPLPGCNPDFSLYAVGTRTIWNPAPQFDIGVEIMYTKLETAFDPGSVRLAYGGGAGRPGGLYVPADQEVWSAIFRMQRNFWP